MKRMEYRGQLDEQRERSPLLLVQFGSAPCTPCTAISQKLDRFLEEHRQVEGLYVPLEDFPEDAAAQGIFTAPAVLLFAEGRLTVRESGYFSLEDVCSRVLRYAELMQETEGGRIP